MHIFISIDERMVSFRIDFTGIRLGGLDYVSWNIIELDSTLEHIFVYVPLDFWCWLVWNLWIIKITRLLKYFLYFATKIYELYYIGE